MVKKIRKKWFLSLIRNVSVYLSLLAFQNLFENNDKANDNDNGDDYSEE